MKIAVTYQDGEIFQHFGHTEFFKIYNVENNVIISTEVLPTNGSGHGALAGFLAENGVETLICGGIGGGAKTALSQAKINLFCGANGNADKAVNDLLNQKLDFNPDTMCTHHENGHTCGEHTCSEHTCSEHTC